MIFGFLNHFPSVDLLVSTNFDCRTHVKRTVSLQREAGLLIFIAVEQSAYISLHGDRSDSQRRFKSM